MFRAALAEVIEDKGSTMARSKNNLYAKLKQMNDDGTLHPSISEWAGEIRILGNAGGTPKVSILLQMRKVASSPNSHGSSLKSYMRCPRGSRCPIRAGGAIAEGLGCVNS